MTRLLTTRQLINHAGNFPGVRINYMDAPRPFVRAFVHGDDMRVVLWPHTDVTLGGVSMLFDVPRCDWDLPMWDIC